MNIGFDQFSYLDIFYFDSGLAHLLDAVSAQTNRFGAVLAYYFNHE